MLAERLQSVLRTHETLEALAQKKLLYSDHRKCEVKSKMRRHDMRMATNSVKPFILAIFSVWIALAVESGRAQNTPLISSDSKWRYDESGLELGNAWKAAAYDDSSWMGPSNILFGFETTPGEYQTQAGIEPLSFRTPLPDPATQFITNFYFRTHFTMPNIASNLRPYTALLSTNWVDDGVIYWLNGVEILRYNMPAGTATASSYASGALTEGYSATVAETIFIRTNYITNLTSLIIGGDNVLAVELHQATNTSSDEVFGMNLTAIIPQPLTITNEPVGETNIVGSSIILNVGVSGSSPSYQWYSNHVRVAGATLASYTANSSSTSEADYYVIATNVLNSVTSSVVHVEVVSDTFAVKLVSACAAPPFTTFSNQLLINFDKALAPAATNPAITNFANYIVGIFGSGITLPVTNIAIGSKQVRLTVGHDFSYATNYVLTVNNIYSTNHVPIAPNSQIGVCMIRSNTPPPFTSLMQFGQNWDFNEGGIDLGTAWRQNNFVEDITWGSGAGTFYFDNLGFNGGCSSAGSLVDQGVTTYYFRTHFTVPAGTPTSGILRVRHVVDDGAVFYLNGTEISRFGFPASVVVNYSSIPSTVGTPTCISNNVNVSNLKVGDNLMAVEVHEAGGANDPDVYFGLQLDFATNYFVFSTNTSPLPPKLLITPKTPTTSVVSWTNTGGRVWGLESSPVLGPGATWAPIPNASPYTNTANSGNKFFRTHAQ